MNRRAFRADRPRVMRQAPTRQAPLRHPEGPPGSARRGRGGARDPTRGVVGGRPVGTSNPGVRRPDVRRPGGDGAGVARATALLTFRHRRRRHGLDNSASRSPSAPPSRSLKYLGRVPRAVPNTFAAVATPSPAAASSAADAGAANDGTGAQGLLMCRGFHGRGPGP